MTELLLVTLAILIGELGLAHGALLQSRDVTSHI
jgi:hypothetical protein